MTIVSNTHAPQTPTTTTLQSLEKWVREMEIKDFKEKIVKLTEEQE